MPLGAQRQAVKYYWLALARLTALAGVTEVQEKSGNIGVRRDDAPAGPTSGNGTRLKDLLSSGYYGIPDSRGVR